MDIFFSKSKKQKVLGVGYEKSSLTEAFLSPEYKRESWKQVLRDIGPIVFRNAFSITNFIIFAVVVLLFVFGDTQAGVFMGLVVFFTVGIGLTQDILARLSLERLQLLTMPHFVRVNEKGETEFILAEEIKKGDRIQLKLGDQIPCDGALEEGRSFEVNEALITGESASFPKLPNEKVLGGSIVTSGSGTVLVETPYAESRISQMTQGLKKYYQNVSPIQRAVDMAIRYSVYILIGVLAFAMVESFLLQVPGVRTVKIIGALASTIVPQGLVIALTLLFAYGAVNLYRRHVLLQEINATEKLGRIKNLCIDKTGTLTGNVLEVEKMHVMNGYGEEEARALSMAYVRGSGDSSHSTAAIEKYLASEFEGTVVEALPFSAWRQYGVVRLHTPNGERVILAGAADIFASAIVNKEERNLFLKVTQEYTHSGRRVISVVEAHGSVFPTTLTNVTLSPIALFIFQHTLRPGIREVIRFFQERGIRIRVISGDNSETVRGVALSAGIHNAEKIITGSEMEAWRAEDFAHNTKEYFIFARTKPEQKEKIIEALKADGFTAMVGDGANDALAIKKADLGIAMFDGAPAARKLAAVVLTNNSFEALPGGVRLADTIIESIEVIGALFFNQAALGLFLFLILSLFGHPYPLTPLNITFINYFTVGFPWTPVFYWAMHPGKITQPASTKPFLKRILPFALVSALIEAIGVALVFAASPDSLQGVESNPLVVIACIVVGFVFFLCAVPTFGGALSSRQKATLWVFGGVETLLLALAFAFPPVLIFFGISFPPLQSLATMAFILIPVGYIQYLFSKKIIQRSNKETLPGKRG